MALSRCHYSDVIMGAMASQSRFFLLNRLFKRRPKKTLKPRVTSLCAGNSPVTGEFPAQKASNAKNVSIWWRHHDIYRPPSYIVPCMWIWRRSMEKFWSNETTLNWAANEIYLYLLFWLHLCKHMLICTKSHHIITQNIICKKRCVWIPHILKRSSREDPF